MQTADLRTIALHADAARRMAQRKTLRPHPGLPEEVLDARRVLGTVDLPGLRLVVWEMPRGDVLGVGVALGGQRVTWLVSVASRKQWREFVEEATFDRLIAEGQELRRQFDRVVAPMRRW